MLIGIYFFCRRLKTLLSDCGRSWLGGASAPGPISSTITLQTYPSCACMAMYYYASKLNDAASCSGCHRRTPPPPPGPQPGPSSGRTSASGLYGVVSRFIYSCFVSSLVSPMFFVRFYLILRRNANWLNLIQTHFI